MSYKVELRHSNTVGGKLCEIEIEWWEVSGKLALEVYTPLAHNIMCDKEVTDPSIEVIGNRRHKHSRQQGSIWARICLEYVQTRLSYSHANPARQVSQKVDIFHTGLLAGEK